MKTHSLLSLTVALLGFLSQCLTRLTPRVSFPMGSPGRQLTCFNSHDVSNTTTLLLSEGGDMLYVGARDALLALDVSHKDAIILKTKNTRASTRYIKGIFEKKFVASGLDNKMFEVEVVETDDVCVVEWLQHLTILPKKNKFWSSTGDLRWGTCRRWGNPAP